MKVSLITGAPRDYLRLEAESVAECASLVRAGQSQFVEPGCLFLVGLDKTTSVSGIETVVLNVILRNYPMDKTEAAMVNAGHDSEP